MQSKILILFLPLVMVFTGCKKKKEDGPPTKTELLNEKPWVYNNAGADTDNNGTIDQAAPSTYLQPCTIDNSYIFNSNGTGTIDEGATKCSSTNPQTSPFSWSFSENETNINLQSTALFGLGGKFKVLTLTETAFEMRKDTSITIPGVPIPLPIGIIIQLKH
jgi:hypothetical protein